MLLIEIGADINAQAGHHGTALVAAASGGQKEIVNLLINQGADVNAEKGLYGNALSAASSHGHIEIVMLLIEMGADIKAQEGVEETKFSTGRRELVDYLINRRGKEKQ